MKKRKKYLIVIAVVFLFLTVISILIVFWVKKKNSETNINKKEELSVAEQYYNENAEIISVKDVTSDNTLSESEVFDYLSEKGFKDPDVTYSYSLTGEYSSEEKADPASNEKHPMYGMYYISQNNEVWYLNIIGEEIFATPLSYCMKYNPAVPIIISTSESTFGYDDEKDKFYKIIPYESAATIKIVDDITAEILDKLTIEEVARL